MSLFKHTAFNFGRRLGLRCAHHHQFKLRTNSYPSPTLTQMRNVTALSLASKKRKGNKITMVTAYDFPSAMHVQRANIDIILVGDSVAMVELGHDTTQPMTMDHMIHHCEAVKRGVVASMQTSESKPKKPLLVGDMVRDFVFLAVQFQWLQVTIYYEYMDMFYHTCSN